MRAKDSGGSQTMEIVMHPVGYIRTNARKIPRHFSISRVEGELVVHEKYREGLEGISPRDRIVVLFWFHKSGDFNPADLTQHPRGDRRRKKRGVFDLCSPLRPNPIGLSVVEVLDIEGTTLRIRGIDMLDGTPILDLKPHKDI